MYKTIEAYLEALKQEMRASDPALLQDALSDAREHLTAALADARQANPGLDEVAVLQGIVASYGSPEETAGAYREVERRTSPALKQVRKPASLPARFLGVYTDPRTWGALLFMFISLITGIIYFTWAATGLSLSFGLIVLIIGVPFILLFLLSVQGVALFEGRLVEALLGVRMPRRPAFAEPGLKWGERLRALVTDKHTWRSLVYMVLQMPIGVFYFTINSTLLTLALGLAATPFLQLLAHQAVITFGDTPRYLPWWAVILFLPVGLLILTLHLQLVRAMGALHGRYAKWLLVS